ncbi:uncharacterized protein LOC117110023 [Anneissia japonica]|uniref:uncharacterized protein LOC117110023 n=1 Tax=Anneissia japonica TaxID=1529436 RepID=UPI0014256D3E|nr:uncharacterized protein LOC117110023 [Anneissia japonica]
MNVEFLTVPKIPAPMESFPTVEELGKWEHLKSFPWENQKSGKVDLLIGADSPQAFWVLDERKGKPRDPYGVKTPLGWSIMGPGGQSCKKGYFNRIHVSNQRLLDEVQKSWAIENSGFSDEQDPIEDMRAREIIRSTIKKTGDNHYEMGLLWRRDEHTMPLNKTMVLSRLTSLKRRLASDKDMHSKYTEVIESYIKKGYAEPVPNEHQWRHVPTDNNPADEGSRGTYELGKWLTGPDSLYKEESRWPVSKFSESDQLTPDPEVKKPVVIVNKIQTCESSFVETLTDKYSSWTKKIRVLGWVLRFIRCLKAKMKHQPITTSNLLVPELEESETMILSSKQKHSFPNWKADKRIEDLNPVLVGNLLRVGGRLDHARIDYNAQHPVILANDEEMVRSLVMNYHQKVGHNGWSGTLNALRERFWILKGRSVVKGILRNCVICKRQNARRGEQQMASLPEERVTADRPPFTFTGIDYFGPIDVRQGRSIVKRYGCIFTCLVTRAIHLEVADNLSTDSFINAYRRFVARRGEPSKLFSDNGTNFVGGEKELRNALAEMNQNIVEEFLHTKGVEWHFNPPSASHFGGVWERLIRSVRKTLYSVLRQQTVNHDVLQTVLAEVESILNSRPLTDLLPEAYDDEPLTPNHLLLMRKGPAAPIGRIQAYGKRRWLQVQYLASLFWTRWKKEYLPLLQKRHKWTTPRQNVEVGDIVLLVDETLHRGRWPMGKVVSVYRSKDEKVRSVDVKVAGGILKRPIAKLCIIYRGSIAKELQ